ncbi:MULTISPECIES: hypothetical protein [unclassified Microbacterium]|uniref:hypothetical protein n=1 Tax=unclassified Microbacterium TaxID=2609290 RepID=UPI00214C620C|nr:MULTISPECIES: hypothetical protein [unclassified Microbacterium]MCR2785097.1 hypothetical protein [Microbacterium sp. zg.B96]WIM16630.1 hypothetical protein QNO11_03040 [Microbacterium sp. zg-B96]
MSAVADGTATLPRPRMILPPAWQLFPVSDDNAATARAAFAGFWENGPRDSIGPFVHELERTLAGALDQARGAGGFAAAMPMGIPWQVPVSTSVVLSHVPAADPQLPPGGERVHTDAGPARRSIRDEQAPADAGDESVVLLRSIDYVWRVPGHDAYLVAFASISGLPVAEYQPVTDALTTLVTTMLDAVTWPDPEGQR